MSARKKYRAILTAVRLGLATDVRMSEGLLGSDTSDVDFNLPGGLRVMICCDRQSLQYRTPTDSAAIGGPRAARKVLAALVANGFADQWSPQLPWDKLSAATRNIATQP